MFLDAGPCHKYLTTRPRLQGATLFKPILFVHSGFGVSRHAFSCGVAGCVAIFRGARDMSLKRKLRNNSSTSEIKSPASCTLPASQCMLYPPSFQVVYVCCGKTKYRKTRAATKLQLHATAWDQGTPGKLMHAAFTSLHLRIHTKSVIHVNAYSMVGSALHMRAVGGMWQLAGHASQQGQGYR